MFMKHYWETVNHHLITGSSFRFKGSILYWISLVVGIACSEPGKESNSTEPPEENQARHATKFKLYQDRVEVLEPWPGAITSKIYNTKEPIEKLVVTSTTHLPFLEMLGLQETLVGFPGTQYIYSPEFRARVDSGKVKDLGPDGALNLEKVLALNPDAVVVFDMGRESTSLDKLEESGIPVIYNSDFLETSALGRAEWVRFFGALFQKRRQADSIFTTIEARYDSLSNLNFGSRRPSVLTGVMYGDTWFLPGGQNWSSELFTDAGAQYLWESDSSSGWLEVSFESVLDRAINADYWVGTSSFGSKDELISQDQRYASFLPYRENKVYSYSKRVGPGGGFDYFESAYARPDIVLEDLISIFHPELVENYERFYFEILPGKE